MDKLSFYEHWPDLPEESILLSFERYPNGKYSCDGVWRRLAELDVGPGKKHGGLQIVAEHDEVLGLRILKKQRKEFENILRPVLDDLWHEFEGPNEGAIIPLDRALAKLGR